MNFRQVHLDFHTSEKVPGVGSRFSKKQFQEALIAGHVNSITVFAKCHHGWAYFTSEKNEKHPTLDRELLREEIEAAHEIGVKAPIYLSAGLDEKLARRHPEWLIRDKAERTTWVPDFTQPGYHRFCFNSPYLDILVAQTEEVCEKFADVGIDGLFFDIVGVAPCYCQNCVRTLIAEGKDPYDPKNALDLAERVYANYTKRIREAVDQYDPKIHVFHNSGHVRRGRRDLAYCDSHLELESLPTGGWGYDHFPLSARYVQQLGMDFLGMTGKFHKTWGEFGGFKHPNAIRYECALSAAMGAKCSIGDQLHPQGLMDMETYKLIGAGYAELEKKEPWLDGVTAKADVGVLSYEACTGLYGTGQTANSNAIDSGAVRILLEGKYLFDVLDTGSDFKKYKVLVLPDEVRVTAELKEKIDAFLAAGGKLLATGKSGLFAEKDEFAFDFGAKYEGVCEYQPTYLRPRFEAENVGDTAYVMYETCEKVTAAGGDVLALEEDPFFNRTVEHFCSHKHTPNAYVYGGAAMVAGRDGIYLAHHHFTDYAENGMLITKRTVCFALDRLLGEDKTLRTNLPAQGVVTLQEQKDEKRFVCHLLYASPVKRGNGVEVIEDLLPICDTEVSLKLDRKIKSAYLAPEKTPIAFTEKDGRVAFKVDRFACHQMIVLDYGSRTQNNS